MDDIKVGIDINGAKELERSLKSSDQLTRSFGHLNAVLNQAAVNSKELSKAFEYQNAMLVEQGSASSLNTAANLTQLGATTKLIEAQGEIMSKNLDKGRNQVEVMKDLEEVSKSIADHEAAGLINTEEYIKLGQKRISLSKELASVQDLDKLEDMLKIERQSLEIAKNTLNNDERKKQNLDEQLIAVDNIVKKERELKDLKKAFSAEDEGTEEYSKLSKSIAEANLELRGLKDTAEEIGNRDAALESEISKIEKNIKTIENSYSKSAKRIQQERELQINKALDAELKRIAIEKKEAEKLANDKLKAENERIASEKKAEDKARRESLAAEKKAEKERIAAAKKAETEIRTAEKKAEKERIAAEKERLAAEKKAAGQETWWDRQKKGMMGTAKQLGGYLAGMFALEAIISKITEQFKQTTFGYSVIRKATSAIDSFALGVASANFNFRELYKSIERVKDIELSQTLSQIEYASKLSKANADARRLNALAEDETVSRINNNLTRNAAAYLEMYNATLNQIAAQEQLNLELEKKNELIEQGKYRSLESAQEDLKNAKLTLDAMSGSTDSVSESIKSGLRSQIDELNKFISLGGDEVSAETDKRIQDLTAAMIDQQSARISTYTYAQNRLRISERDVFEQELDYLIDYYDNQRTINERLIADETLTYEERWKLVDKNNKLMKDSHKTQVELIEERSKNSIDLSILNLSESLAKVTESKPLEINVESLKPEQFESIKEYNDAINDAKIANDNLRKAHQDSIGSLSSQLASMNKLKEVLPDVNMEEVLKLDAKEAHDYATQILALDEVTANRFLEILRDGRSSLSETEQSILGLARSQVKYEQSVLASEHEIAKSRQELVDLQNQMNDPDLFINPYEARITDNLNNIITLNKQIKDDEEFKKENGFALLDVTEKQNIQKELELAYLDQHKLELQRIKAEEDEYNRILEERFDIRMKEAQLESTRYMNDVSKVGEGTYNWLNSDKETQFNRDQAEFQYINDMTDLNFSLSEKEFDLATKLNLTYKERADLILEIEDIKEAIENKDIERYNRKRKEDEEDKQRQYDKYYGILDVSSQVFGAMSDLAEEGSEEAKQLAIAEATVTAIMGAMNAYTSTLALPAPTNAILAPIAAAAALATGVANIKAIQNESISSVSTGTNAPIYSAEPIKYTETLFKDSTIDQINKGEQKVYVVASEITNAQNMAKTRVKLNTY